MRKKIQLSTTSSEFVPDLMSFKCIVTAINPEEMTDKIFVKQRIRNFAKDTFEDFFVAVCTPVQLEDFDADAPAEGTSYYRTNKIEIVVRTAEMVTTVVESLLYEVAKLVMDLNDMDDMVPEKIYQIT
jgi:hypothetical protein